MPGRSRWPRRSRCRRSVSIRIGRFNFIYEEAGPLRQGARGAQDEGLGGREGAMRGRAREGPDAPRCASPARDRARAAGRQGGGGDHLVTALAADYYAYGRPCARQGPRGVSRDTAGRSGELARAADPRRGTRKRIRAALWVVGRRSPFRWPDKPGVQYAYSRGEVYAYDRDSKRFFRLTHTDHQVIAFVRPANETAVLGFDKVDHPGRWPRRRSRTRGSRSGIRTRSSSASARCCPRGKQLAVG